MHRVTGHVEAWGERAGIPEGLPRGEGSVMCKGRGKVIKCVYNFRYT